MVSSTPAASAAFAKSSTPMAYFPPSVQRELWDRGGKRLQQHVPHSATDTTTVCYIGTWWYGGQTGMLAEVVEGFKQLRAREGERMRLVLWLTGECLTTSGIMPNASKVRL